MSAKTPPENAGISMATRFPGMSYLRFGFIALTVLVVSAPVAAQTPPPYNRLCDPAYENCRDPLIQLIRAENVGIDVGFWFMEDSRYSAELIRKHEAGVPVRVVFDSQ